MSLTLFIIILVGLFLTTYFLIPLNIGLSKKTGFVSYPNKRSMHKVTQPTSGGLSFALPIIIVEIIISFISKNNELSTTLIKIALGGFLIFIVGLLDDKYNIKAKYKLILQILIALLMCLLGFQIKQFTNPFADVINISVFAYPITIFWYLIIMNALNLIDGLDGLASGITIITCIVLISASLYYSHYLVFYISSLLCFSLLAFLKYNYPPSRIFMGDCGSLFIGFQLATISIIGSSQLKGLTTMTLMIPVTVLFVPLFDTALSVVRRLKTKQHIFQADKNHIHHQMLNVGFSTKTVMYIAWFITALFGIISLGYVFVSKQIMVIMLFILSVILGAIFYFLLRKEFFK